MRTKILTYYTEISKLEGLTLLPVRFCKVGKGGAMVIYNPTTKIPIAISFDLNGLHDPEFAVLHEIAHIILLYKKGYAGHNSDFKKEHYKLMDKYTYSDLCMRIFAIK